MSKKEDVYQKTKKTVQKSIKRANELGISDIVVASCSGKTAGYLVDCGLDVTCVTHQIGFKSDNEDEMEKDMREYLLEKGLKILTTTHLFAGVDRALRMQFKGIYPSEIVSTTLRMFGQGIKVCVEISIMATDAGLVRAGKDLIAIGGTGIGADTSAVINPQHSQDLFKTKVKEVIVKPFDF